MAGRMYPIWNNVSSCIYNSSKSFGARDTSQTVVCVGTSKSNSEVLVTHVTTRRIQGNYTVFKFGVDLHDDRGLQVLKTLWMNTNTQEWFDVCPPSLREVAKPKHEHTKKCYQQDMHGHLVYTPCRADGLDRNKTTLADIDFESGIGLSGLTLICSEVAK